jgi:hypothetical protein
MELDEKTKALVAEALMLAATRQESISLPSK